MKRQKEILSVFIIVAFVGLIGLVRWAKTQRARDTVSPATVSKTLGHPDAPVHIIEYSDFQCSACAKGQGILKEFLAREADRIFLEFRYFLIEEIHPQAFRSAVYAECAARQKYFWPFHDLLFSAQTEWSRAGEGGETYFKAYARSSGLDMGQLEACVQDSAVESAIEREIVEARFRGVSATPTFFINGKMVIGTTALRNALTQLFPGSDGDT
ncbi:MAG TPA: thioredoxin domain-containing protein [Candidatus Omnitrophota bacterium]|nr:DsbA family protein [Candidatus Omnitrophota bacterium]HQO57421.1 thioredoxin domain-containing protein [Candidatus Omnitrophota bacterium]